ncbi:MAG: phytanoyl-CoA dioxygenase, partial [Alphaproteobacteria bacterium]|nr:phytanoyl-CoA dioxygenase [Alphaproteobacteria bacterium]
MGAEQANELRLRLEAHEAATGGPLRGDLRHKAHLLFAWLGDLVRNDVLLDAVEDLHGPDLLDWTSNFFIKEPRSPGFVSWHQDSTYWGLSRPDVVTAWVALSAS